ncbi:MAG: methyltransferase domain-containing protein [Flavobacteriales bacterium]|nr:methyltransferase domain-containing protein [Flavobacteriales bacterium]
MNTAAGAGAAKEAFSRQAAVFDRIDEANPLIGWVRERVRKASLACMHAGERVLELNAGTGIDSVFLAEQGLQVLATDQAPGMVRELQAKQRPGLTLEVMELSFLDLARLQGRTFDHVFSNFGGLNCTDRLDEVVRNAYGLLRPGGHLHLVIMPRTCLWELAWMFQGRFKEAFRRRRKNGTRALVEDVAFTCHYYDPSEVIAMVPGAHRVLHLQGLSVLYPPPHAQAIATGWPAATTWLGRLDDRISRTRPFRAWGDHYHLIIQRKA